MSKSEFSWGVEYGRGGEAFDPTWGAQRQAGYREGLRFRTIDQAARQRQHLWDAMVGADEFPAFKLAVLDWLEHEKNRDAV